MKEDERATEGCPSACSYTHRANIQAFLGAVSHLVGDLGPLSAPRRHAARRQPGLSPCGCVAVGGQPVALGQRWSRTTRAGTCRRSCVRSREGEPVGRGRASGTIGRGQAVLVGPPRDPSEASVRVGHRCQSASADEEAARSRKQLPHREGQRSRGRSSSQEGKGQRGLELSVRAAVLGPGDTSIESMCLALGAPDVGCSA